MKRLLPINQWINIFKQLYSEGPKPAHRESKNLFVRVVTLLSAGGKENKNTHKEFSCETRSVDILEKTSYGSIDNRWDPVSTNITFAFLASSSY